ncbi:MAG: choice-of-anchor K domain-containing protein [Acidobacteria bacterium]|nr:choice-of-anchor K domain-containing protein [Acidobacteriota bacterium]
MKFKLLALTATLAISATAGTFTGLTVGAFSDPITSGYVWGAGGRESVLTDNASSAVFSGFWGVAGTTAVAKWGNYPIADFPLPDGVDQESTLQFDGVEFEDVIGDQTIFKIGSITFTNGTSVINSLLFGGTLTITPVDFGWGYLSDPLVIPFSIETTRNVGSPEFNADFVVFETELGKVGAFVYEGASATFNIYAKIVGDPQTSFQGLQIDRNSLGNGFVGGASPVPEPASLWLAGAALAGLAWARRR